MQCVVGIPDFVGLENEVFQELLKASPMLQGVPGRREKRWESPCVSYSDDFLSKLWAVLLKLLLLTHSLILLGRRLVDGRRR